MQKMKFFLFFMFTFLSFTACSGEKTVHWKQEVQLHDGRVIVIGRDSEQVSETLPENKIVEKKQVISFQNPDNLQKIIWDIPKGLLPYTLDFDNQIPYLVLVAYGVGDYNKWSCPNPPFLVYRYDGKNWNSIPLEMLPSRFEKRNLIDLGKIYQKYAASETASLADVENFLKRRSKRDRVISREKVSSMAEGCNPDTLKKLGRQSEINYGR